MSKTYILSQNIDSKHGSHSSHQQMLATSLWPGQIKIHGTQRSHRGQILTSTSDSSLWLHYRFIFLTSHLFIDREDVIKCFFPSGNIAPVLKAKFIANGFPDPQECSLFFHLWHLPEERALEVDEAQHSRFSFASCTSGNRLAWSGSQVT